MSALDARLPVDAGTRGEAREVDVFYTDPRGAGWVPVERLATLTARLLDARLTVFTHRRFARHLALFAARQHLPRRRGGERIALVIAPRPEHLTAVLRLGPLATRYDRLAGWVIDSFWHERIPHVARSGRFDQLYVMDEDDRDAWESACPTTAVGVLPWGADTLGAAPIAKTTDIQRFGRMPADWDDDAAVARLARSRGLEFRGRPPFGDDAAEGQRNVDAALAAARYTLAFSNLVSAAPYTHPTRDYLTARWTDSLAHGAVVAGVAPTSTTARSLLWPGATVEIPAGDLDEGVAALAQQVRAWTPALAEENRRQARRTLDWRHRIAVIAEDLAVAAPRLELERRQLSTT